MIKIEVTLFATLRRYHPEKQGKKSFTFTVSAGTTVAQLLDHLGIPAEEVKMTFVNNLRKTKEYVLQDGDNVGIFPPIAGG